MSEQSPKTPRQVGEEAEDLYHTHRRAAAGQSAKSRYLQHVIDVVQWDHGAALAKESGKEEHKGESLAYYTPEQLRGGRDEKMTYLPSLILQAGEASDWYDANLDKAAAHYKDNADTYHELAVHEAALYGVEIKITQSESPAEQIEVHKS